MIHQRQRLPLGLETRQHLPAIHPGLDELQRHSASDRLGLLGHPDRAHAPFADLLQQLVSTGDGRAGRIGGKADDGLEPFRRRGVQQFARLVVRLEKRLDAGPQLVVFAALLLQQPGAFRRSRAFGN